MALLHHTDLVPSKLELVAGWLPSQPFYPADAAGVELTRVASFRFDDPAGEVGVETLLVGAGSVTLQIPLTYRGSAMEGADSALLGTTEHGVLGTRWVYDATCDPVYVSELVRVVLTGGTEVEQHYVENGVTVPKASDARVRGSGHPDADVPSIAGDPASLTRVGDGATTTLTSKGVSVTIARVVGAAGTLPNEGETLTGDWDGTAAAVLAVVGRA